MEQKTDNIPSSEIMDSPSANTRSKIAVTGGGDQKQSPNVLSVTPKKEKPSGRINTKGSRTPGTSDRTTSSAKSSKSKLSEIRAAALKKKRQEMAKGSSTLNQALYDPDATAREAKHITKSETGLVIDDFMERHFSPWDANHVERPERLQYIRKRIDELGLPQRCKKVRKYSRTIKQGGDLFLEKLF